jgi:hypothetical protein
MDSIYILGKITYYITKRVKNADLGRNLYDSKGSIVGQICDDVCMKHDIPSRHIVLPIFLFFVEKKEGEDNVILLVNYFWWNGLNHYQFQHFVEGLGS